MDHILNGTFYAHTVSIDWVKEGMQLSFWSAFNALTRST